MKLTEILRKHTKEYKIYEGLILTHSLQQSLSILTTTFPSIKISRVKDNTFVVGWQSNEPVDFDKLLQMLNNLGWFFSFVWVDENNDFKYSEKTVRWYLTNKYKKIKLSVEAKYDIEVDRKDIPDFLYHVTSPTSINKIMKIGLSPRSRSKIAEHPGRIYLVLSLNKLNALIHLFKQKTGQTDWKILKVDTRGTLSNYLRLFKDPNFDDGVYTLNNIPPSALTPI